MKLVKLLFFCIYSFVGFSQHLVINEFVASNESSLQDEDGDYPDWIELYNSSNSQIDLAGYFLSDDLNNPKKWIFPSVPIESKKFLIVFASGKDKVQNEIHTNFKINSEGEHLLLSNSAENIIDSVLPVNLEKNQSYGRYEDGENNFSYLNIPTPGAPNSQPKISNEILFSIPAGFYNLPLNLSISSSDSVYYTTDGSEPSLGSNLFIDQISISPSRINNYSLIPTTHLSYDPDIWPNREFGFQEPPGGEVEKGTVIRARSYRNGTPTSKIITKTYFNKNTEYSFPIFSLVTDSLNLFDYDMGIYVTGKNFNSDNLDWTGNYHMRGKEWERIGNVEYFNKNGEVQFSENAGIRISGNKSRSSPQKSLRLYFREEYGRSEIEYSFFPSRNYQDYKRLTLRSSFTYWWGRNSLFTDDLIHKIVSDGGIDMEIQKSQPSLVFINGEYWGVHNIRERQDKYYLRSLYGIDKDSVNIIAGNMHVTEGSAQSFIDLIDFVESHEMSDSTNYAYVKNEIEINNYIDYYIIELYFNNQDWPGNNMKMWKSKTPGSKWRWMLYDLDAAFSDYTIDPFISLNEDQSNQALFFKKLLQNEEFKEQFFSRFSLHAKTAFNPDISREYIDEMRLIYAQEIDEHIERWGIPTSYNKWVDNCDFLENYIENRPCVMESILIQNLNLDTSTLELICNDLKSHISNSESVFSVYPNPSSGEINIYTKSKIQEEYPFKIIDTRGKLLHQELLCCGKKEVNLSFLKNGFYFLGLSFENKYYYQKIFIQH